MKPKAALALFSRLPNMLEALLWLILFLIVGFISGRLILFYKLRNVPHRKTGLLGLILGDIVHFRNRPSSQNIDPTTRMILEYFDIFKEEKLFVLWRGWTPVIIIKNLEGFETLLSNKNILLKGRDVDLLYPWIGTGLVASTSTKWLHRKKMITPAFHFKVLEDFIPAMINHTRRSVNELADQAAITLDVSKMTQKFTLSVLIETAMGLGPHDIVQSFDEYLEAVHEFWFLFVQRLLEPSGRYDFIYFRTKKGKRFLALIDILKSFSRKAIEKRLSEFSQESDEESDNKENFGRKRKRALMDTLIETHLKDPEKLSLEGVQEEVDTFMLAGHDTTATAIMWAIFILGNNSDVQESLYYELRKDFDSDLGKINLNSIMSHKYLDLCVKECMRIVSVAPFILKRHSDELKVCGITLPKDVDIMLNFFFHFRDPKVYKNPTKFDPQRFLDDRERSPYAFIPFSAGPRNCIGQKFALLEIKIFLAYLVLNFEFKSCVTLEDVRFNFAAVTRPTRPLEVTFSRR